MMLQIATVYAGALYDVDPFDQPGVELGKQLTYGLMGRTGFNKPDIAAVDPRYIAH
jgi:glucose-6-phosphate isomerase